MRGGLHHVELWVPDLTRAVDSIGWLLTALGYAPYQEWAEGRSWRLGNTYIVVEHSPALTDNVHDRCRPGLNHFAFGVGDISQLDKFIADATDHGWALLFPTAIPTPADLITTLATSRTMTASRSNSSPPRRTTWRHHRLNQREAAAPPSTTPDYFLDCGRDRPVSGVCWLHARVRERCVLRAIWPSGPVVRR